MKIVLAYSGGLDTSVILSWLKEKYDAEIIAYCANIGQEEELKGLEAKAKSTGGSKCYIADLQEEFARDFIFPMIQAGAIYESQYLLGTSIARPLIAKGMVEIAKQEQAEAIAHGATGKGNDQVRFEVGISSLDPELQIVAPVREWDLHTREQEMDYAIERGIPVPTTKKSPYSIDDNLWGRAIECGVLEDPWVEPPADIYTLTSDARAEECGEPEYAEISFEQGLPTALNGQAMSFHDIIVAMNDQAGKHGFGRIDMIENRLIGVKSREVYEVPGALTLIQAHKALEDLCLEREVLHYKLGVEQKWAELVYNGLWFSPLKEALDGFVDTTQKLVTGDVRLRFFKGSCVVVGRRSPYSLYDYNLATYDAADTFDHKAAKGFIDLWGLPTKVWARQRRKVGKEGEV